MFNILYHRELYLHGEPADWHSSLEACLEHIQDLEARFKIVGEESIRINSRLLLRLDELEALVEAPSQSCGEEPE